MNRLLSACCIAVFGTMAFGCAATGIGDPCTPEEEFSKSSGSAQPEDLVIDVNSVQCETRVCLRHYFRGRVSCPFGNGNKTNQTGRCQATTKRGLFTLDGTVGGELCCPVIGDLEEKPLANPVEAQCKGRPASAAVYCSCRCDVPDDPDIDRSQVSLCKCPSGFTCKPLCNQKDGNCGIVPKGKWGSYCVRDGGNGAGFDPAQHDAKCGADLKPADVP